MNTKKQLTAQQQQQPNKASGITYPCTLIRYMGEIMFNKTKYPESSVTGNDEFYAVDATQSDLLTDNCIVLQSWAQEKLKPLVLEEPLSSEEKSSSSDYVSKLTLEDKAYLILETAITVLEEPSEDSVYEPKTNIVEIIRKAYEDQAFIGIIDAEQLDNSIEAVTAKVEEIISGQSTPEELYKIARILHSYA